MGEILIRPKLDFWPINVVVYGGKGKSVANKGFGFVSGLENSFFFFILMEMTSTVYER